WSDSLRNGWQRTIQVQKREFAVNIFIVQDPMNNGTRIPPALALLKLPSEICEELKEQARALGVDPEKLIEAHRQSYTLGFYDGVREALNRLAAGAPRGWS